MAQFGRALRSGRRGRRFKSCHPDHFLFGRAQTRFFYSSSLKLIEDKFFREDISSLLERIRLKSYNLNIPNWIENLDNYVR